MRLRMLKLSVGKLGSSSHETAMAQSVATVATERAGYVLYRALVFSVLAVLFVCLKFLIVWPSQDVP